MTTYTGRLTLLQLTLPCCALPDSDLLFTARWLLPASSFYWLVPAPTPHDTVLGWITIHGYSSLRDHSYGLARFASDTGGRRTPRTRPALRTAATGSLRAGLTRLDHWFLLPYSISPGLQVTMPLVLSSAAGLLSLPWVLVALRFALRVPYLMPPGYTTCLILHALVALHTPRTHAGSPPDCTLPYGWFYHVVVRLLFLY